MYGSTYKPGCTAESCGVGGLGPVGRVAEPPAFGLHSCRSAAIRRSERAIVRCS